MNFRRCRRARRRRGGVHLRQPARQRAFATGSCRIARGCRGTRRRPGRARDRARGCGPAIRRRRRRARIRRATGRTAPGDGPFAARGLRQACRRGLARRDARRRCRDRARLPLSLRGRRSPVRISGSEPRALAGRGRHSAVAATRRLAVGVRAHGLGQADRNRCQHRARDRRSPDGRRPARGRDCLGPRTCVFEALRCDVFRSCPCRHRGPASSRNTCAYCRLPPGGFPHHRASSRRSLPRPCFPSTQRLPGRGRCSSSASSRRSQGH